MARIESPATPQAATIGNRDRARLPSTTSDSRNIDGKLATSRAAARRGRQLDRSNEMPSTDDAAVPSRIPGAMSAPNPCVTNGVQ